MNKTMPWTKTFGKGVQIAAVVVPFLLKKHPVVAAVITVAGITVEVIEIWRRER